MKKIIEWLEDHPGVYVRLNYEPIFDSLMIRVTKWDIVSQYSMKTDEFTTHTRDITDVVIEVLDELHRKIEEYEGQEGRREWL